MPLINFDGSSQSFQYGQKFGISKQKNSCVKLTLYSSDENGNDKDIIQEKTIDFDDQSEYWSLDSDTFDSRRLKQGKYIIYKCVGSSIEDISDVSKDQTKIEYAKAQFEIVPRSINEKTFNVSSVYDSHNERIYGPYKISSNPLVYNGKNQYPSFDISNDEDLINPSSSDYDLDNFRDKDGVTIDADNLINAGTYTAKLTFKNDFSGSIDVSFSISPYQIDDSYDNIKLNYDRESGVTFDIDNSGGFVVSQNDFKVSYEKDGQKVDSISESGNYTAILTFFGNYSGEKRIDFNVPESSYDNDEQSEKKEENLKKDLEWGRKEIRHEIVHYISDDGLLSVEIDKNDKIWICETEDNANECWYCLDNTGGIFKIGSRFSIKWLSKGDPEYDSEISKVNESINKNIDLDKSKIFLVSVTDPDGNEYSTFDKLDFYIQISGNWTKDNIRALFANSSDNEILEAYFETVNSPVGPIECARLVLTHFSPYLIAYRSSKGSHATQPIKDKSSSSNESSSAPLGDPINYILLCSLLCSILIYYFISKKHFIHKKRKNRKIRHYYKR